MMTFGEHLSTLHTCTPSSSFFTFGEQTLAGHFADLAEVFRRFIDKFEVSSSALLSSDAREQKCGNVSELSAGTKSVRQTVNV